MLGLIQACVPTAPSSAIVAGEFGPLAIINPSVKVSVSVTTSSNSFAAVFIRDAVLVTISVSALPAVLRIASVLPIVSVIVLTTVKTREYVSTFAIVSLKVDA